MESIQPWLEHTEWSIGALQRYASSLEENFDGPEQLVDIYTKRLPNGKETFDYKQFFEDVGVEDPAHRKLFEYWFSGKAPVDRQNGVDKPLPQAAAARVTSAFPGVGINGAQTGTMANGHVHAEVVPNVTPPNIDSGINRSLTKGGTGTAAMKEWVRSIDWFVGTLKQYEKAFEENFDNPEQYPDQIVEAYVTKKGDEKIFDDKQFFKDLGIEDESHRDLFRAWFAMEHGARVKA